MLKCSAPPTPIIMNLRNPKVSSAAIESARQMSTNIKMEIRKRRSAKRGFPERKPADSLGGWYHCTGYRRKDGLRIQHG